jgi:hypothetical protein
MDVCLYTCLSYSAENYIFDGPHYFVVCGLSGSNKYFYIISEMTRFWGKTFMKMKCMGWFSMQMCLKPFSIKKHLAIYYHKFTYAFM